MVDIFFIFKWYISLLIEYLFEFSKFIVGFKLNNFNFMKFKKLKKIFMDFIYREVVNIFMKLCCK